jgi:glutamyl-tRNA reductase
MAFYGELGMVGTTFRRAGQGGLAYYTLPAAPQSQEAELRRLMQACKLSECVYLATCNRVELFFITSAGQNVARVRKELFAFFAARNGAQDAPFADARQLHAFAGEGAVERLFVVACALDSMVPGEAQILGQVKAAFVQAQAHGACGPLLAPVFEAAFATAKQVRAHTTLGQGRTSMLSLVMALIDQRVTQTSAVREAQVVVVGAGDMAEQCARTLHARPHIALHFVNRSLPRAQALAERCGGRAHTLQSYLQNPGPTDILLSATASQTILFDAPYFAALARNAVPSAMPLIIDLAIPRDVAPQAAQAAGAPLWDVDRMQTVAAHHAESRRQAIASARAVVDDALDMYRRREAERSMGHAIARMRNQGQTQVQQALAALEDALPPDVRAQSWPQIERFARTLWGQMAHNATRGLKALAHDHGPEALDAYLRGAGLATPPPPGPDQEQL